MTFKIFDLIVYPIFGKNFCSLLSLCLLYSIKSIFKHCAVYFILCMFIKKNPCPNLQFP